MQPKALYNLLRFNWLEDQSLEVESWQIEDLRQVSNEELFIRLHKFGIILDQARLHLYAESCETPEELIECLWIEEEEEESQFDQAYLIVFELWRRFLPQKQSLSIFCDELDHRMALYDRDALGEDELQEALKTLEDILDENVDKGGDPQEIFATITSYCAHDLERFIYDYIVDQIDAENEMGASELLEEFYPYIKDPKWFDFLRAVLFAVTEAGEAQLQLRRVLEQLQEEPDFDLLIEIAEYLVHRGERSLFIQTVNQALQLMEKEGQFQELLEVIVRFFQCNDRDEEYQTFQALMKKRADHAPDLPLKEADRDVELIRKHVRE
jgi:hypothetical protein